jgi:hypothetical protein
MTYLICFHGVMAGLVPAIHVSGLALKNVDARVKPWHDDRDGCVHIT